MPRESEGVEQTIRQQDGDAPVRHPQPLVPKVTEEQNQPRRAQSSERNRVERKYVPEIDLEDRNGVNSVRGYALKYPVGERVEDFLSSARKHDLPVQQEQSEDYDRDGRQKPCAQPHLAAPCGAMDQPEMREYRRYDEVGVPPCHAAERDGDEHNAVVAAP